MKTELQAIVTPILPVEHTADRAPSWMVAITLPRCAFSLSDDLYSLGFESYAPAARDYTIIRGRKVWGDYPLLGGYVLVRETTRWPEIFRVEDFKSMIMDGDRDTPRLVPDREVQYLKTLEVDGRIGRRTAGKFKRGDRVSIGVGQFANLMGTYDGESGESGAFVLLSLLGRGHRVKMPEAAIEAA